MGALSVAPELIKQNIYSFNKHHVCTNPEKVFSFHIDYANYLEITVAQHPENGRWCIGVDYGSNQVGSYEGGGYAASHNPAEPGTGYLTAQEGLKKSVNHIVEKLTRFPLHPKILEALRAYAVTIDIVVSGYQLHFYD